jgi:hypothetical protein
MLPAIKVIIEKACTGHYNRCTGHNRAHLQNPVFGAKEKKNNFVE